MVERESRYVEVAGGMHHVVNGQLVETEEKFELIPGGAVARGRHVVTISGDFQANGVVNQVSAEVHVFKSHLLGLACTDMTTGQSVLIGEPQQSVGELVAPNVILFRDAMAAPVRCDVRYTFTRNGFSQDVICRTRLPDPGEWGRTLARMKPAIMSRPGRKACRSTFEEFAVTVAVARKCPTVEAQSLFQSTSRYDRRSTFTSRSAQASTA